MRLLASGVLVFFIAGCSLRNLDDLTAANGAPECIAPASDADVHQALPRAYLDTSVPDESDLQVVRIGKGGDLQGALDAAAGGQLILLSPGASYGPVTFGRGGSDWTIVRTDTDALPAPGVRMTAGMPLAKILSGVDGTPALRAVENARLFRVEGVEIAARAGAPTPTHLVELGPDNVDPAHLPRNVVLDRVHAHGGGTCIALNGQFGAIVDSLIDGCDRGIEFPAGGGPYRVANNDIEGETGFALVVNGEAARPSDVEIARNRFVRAHPSGTDDAIVGIGDADRVLVACNVLEASTAYAFSLVPESSPSDVTIVYDVSRGAPILIDNASPKRILIANDLFEHAPEMFRINGTLPASKIDHVTVVDWNTVAYSLLNLGNPTNPLWLTNGIFSATQFGIHGTALGSGNQTISTYLAPGKVVGNAFVGETCSNYPPGNTCPSTVQSLGLEGPNDLRLREDSVLRGTAADGSDPGADIAGIGDLTSGVAP